MRKKLLFLWVISVIACILIPICKDIIVIHYGIRVYRSVSTDFLFIVSVLSVIVMVCIVFDRKHNCIMDDVAETESSIFNDYERRKLYNDIYDEVGGKWEGLKLPLGKLLRNLDDMGEQRNSLKRLLENNASEDILDTPELLHKVEDCMYTNVRKLLNYAYVISESDESYMLSKIDDCRKKNKALLKQAKDFTLAVADYINSSVDDDDRSLALIKTYRDTVLVTIDKTDIYLN